MSKDAEIVIGEIPTDVPEFQYQLVEWKTPDRTEVLYESEIFDDLIQACNFMHHTLHKQKGFAEIRRIQNTVIRMSEGEGLENYADEIFAWLQSQAETSH